MTSAWIDRHLARRSLSRAVLARSIGHTPEMRIIETAQGSVRARVIEPPHARAAASPVVFVCDNPVLIEHYGALLARVARRRRAICFEAIGFGFSRPSRSFRRVRPGRPRRAARRSRLGAREPHAAVLRPRGRPAAPAHGQAGARSLGRRRQDARQDRAALASRPRAEGAIRRMGPRRALPGARTAGVILRPPRELRGSVRVVV